MTSLLPMTKAQFFNGNTPLSSGKVYFFASDGTTPKDTYTDSSGNIANANPVVLDSNGQANIWISGSYKATVKDSTDTIIWTTDTFSDAQAVVPSMFTGGTTTGSANVQVLATTTPDTFTLATGNVVNFIAGYSNSGSATLAVHSTTAKAIKKTTASGLANVATGDIIATGVYNVTYDGTQYVLNTPTYGTGGIMTNSVDNTLLSQMPTLTIKGNNTGGTANAADLTVAQVRTMLGLGTAAYLDVGTGPSNIVQLDGSSKLPAVDGSNLTNIGSNAVVGRAYGSYTSNTDLNTIIPLDDTIPQNTEGTQIISVSYTAASATNRLRFTFSGTCDGIDFWRVTSALFIDTTANALFASLCGNNFANNAAWTFEMVVGDTSTHDYKIRVGANSGKCRFNGSTSARYFGGAAVTSLIIEELKV